MPQFREVRTLAAGETIENIMTGSPFERVGGLGAHVKVYAVQASNTLGDAQMSVLLGSDLIIQNAGLGLRTAGVVIPDDQIADGDALPGDQITVRLVNTDGAATTIVQTTVDITNV